MCPDVCCALRWLCCAALLTRIARPRHVPVRVVAGGLLCGDCAQLVERDCRRLQLLTQRPNKRCPTVPASNAKDLTNRNPRRLDTYLSLAQGVEKTGIRDRTLTVFFSHNPINGKIDVVAVCPMPSGRRGGGRRRRSVGQATTHLPDKKWDTKVL